MEWFFNILIILIALILLIALAFLVWFWASPMPVVRLLRRAPGASLGYPPNYDEYKSRVEVKKGFVYPSHEKRNTLDLYTPKKLTNPLPLIIWAHGGGFVAGEKEGIENWATCLASEGFAVAALDYQWAPEAHWPAQVLQICEGCTFLGTISAEYNLDMNRVVIAGDSAGAHMAAQFALIHTSPAFSEVTHLQPVLLPGALKAALLYCGPYDISAMARPKDRRLRLFMHRIGWSYLGIKRWEGSPKAAIMTIRNFVSESFPPTYITDGNVFSFEAQARALVKALRQKSVSISSRFFPIEEGEVTHEYQFSLGEDNAWLSYQDTLRFLQTEDLP